MKPMTKWMTFLAAAIFLSACTSDEPAPEVRCERVDVEDEEYCIYEQPITETGYDCPQDLANSIEFEGATICSRQDEIPEAHRAPVRDELERLGDDGDQGPNNLSDDPEDLPDGTWQGEEGRRAIDALCNAPEQFDGQNIAFSGELIFDDRLIDAIDCSGMNDAGDDAGDGGCYSCARSSTVFLLKCDPDDPRIDDILLKAASGLRSDVGCSGSNCRRRCEPAEPEEIVSMSGTFRYGGRYQPDYDYHHGSFSMVIEVDDYELAN